MASWPNLDEFKKWISSQQQIGITKEADQIPPAFAAALDVVQDDVCFELFPAYDADADPVQTVGTIDVPERVRLAVFILANRLLSRGDSPTGVVGFTEFAIRVGNDDPDYRRLVNRYYVPGIA